MTINQRLRTGLLPLGLPVVPDTDTAHRDRCITFNYTQQPANWADNRPLYWRYLIQVHLFLPGTEDSLVLRIRIVTALIAGGFAYPEILDLTDDEGQHYVYETTYFDKMEV